LENNPSEKFPSEETTRSTPSPPPPPDSGASPSPTFESPDRYDGPQAPPEHFGSPETRGDWRFPKYPPSPPPPSAFSQWGLPLVLFSITVFTTLWAGAYAPFAFRANAIGPIDLLIRTPWVLVNGLPFAGTLLFILVTHEFGHYFFARLHKVPVSLPLFIPGPPHLIGTFGAIIRMRSPIMNRRALFDIGVAGPIAGFIVSVIALSIGLFLSEVKHVRFSSAMQFGDPLLLQFLGWLILGPIPEFHTIVVGPIAFAAWLGLFVTAINLLPMGQMDGGHIAYALFGNGQRALAFIIIPVLAILGVFGWKGWFLWVGLAGLIGFSHPPVSDPHTELGTTRVFVGWITLAIFILSFTPVPFYTG